MHYEQVYAPGKSRVRACLPTTGIQPAAVRVASRMPAADHPVDTETMLSERQQNPPAGLEQTHAQK